MRRPPRRKTPLTRVMRWLPCLVGGALAVTCGSPAAVGLERLVKTRIANHEHAPVVLRGASIHLVQTYSAPTQFPLATVEGGKSVAINRSRVRYANRRNQDLPTYLLEGELTLENGSRKRVEAFQITSVFLNAFRERISMDRYSIAESLAPRKTLTIPWSRNFPHQEVFETFFVITAVRFDDGTVWAPTEELILLP